MTTTPTTPRAVVRASQLPTERSFLTLDLVGWEKTRSTSGDPLLFSPVTCRVLWAREWDVATGRWGDWIIPDAYVTGPRILVSGALSTKRFLRAALDLGDGARGYRTPCPAWLAREIDAWRPSFAESLVYALDLGAGA